MADGTPAVSVIMSVWNGIPYVAETIDSILNQTFTDFEFIINDNCSSDGTAAYLLERAKTDPRLKVLISEENRGCAGGFNRCSTRPGRLGWRSSRATTAPCLSGSSGSLPSWLSTPASRSTAPSPTYIDSDGKRVAKTHHELATQEVFHRYMAENEAIGILNPGAFIDRETMVALGGYPPGLLPRRGHRPLGPHQRARHDPRRPGVPHGVPRARRLVRGTADPPLAV